MRVGWAMVAWGSIALTSASAWADDGWTRHDVGSHGLSVELPDARPETEHTSSFWVLGTAESDHVRAQTEAGAFAVSATVAPMSAIKMAGQPLIFSTTKDTFLRKMSGDAVSWEPCAREGLEGRRLVYRRKDSGHLGTMEVYVRDNLILTFDVQAPKERLGAVVERFFASIDL